MNNMKKYTWEVNKEEELWSNALFDSVDECIKDALQSGVDNYTIYVGEVFPYAFKVDAFNVLDHLADDAYDDVGDIANGWPYYGSNETLDDLSDDLTICVKNWLIKRNNMPSFYEITNIREVKIDEKLVE